MPITFSQIQAVNDEVNFCVIYTPDLTQWGQDDRWEDGMESGKEDCEGYAIAKLRKLLELGCARSDLKLALCYTETGEYHCVLCVMFESEDWILDNRYADPMRWALLDYKWDRFYLLNERKWWAAA